MPVRAQGRAVDRPVVSVPRHIGGVAVEGVVGDQPGGEAARRYTLEGDPEAYADVAVARVAAAALSGTQVHPVEVP